LFERESGGDGEGQVRERRVAMGYSGEFTSGEELDFGGLGEGSRIGDFLQ